MSGQEEQGEEGEAEEGSPEGPTINLFLQEAVYALMAEFDIQINPNPPPLPPPPPPLPEESRREFSRSASGLKIRFIAPKMPLKKRPYTGGVNDSEENEKNKREKKEEKQDDKKPIREPVEDYSMKNAEKMEEEDDQEPRNFEPAEEEDQKKDQKPRSEPGEDSQEDERKKKEEDDQLPSEESLENEQKILKEDDQVSRIEPSVQDSQEDGRLNKKEDVHEPRNDATEGSKKIEIGEGLVQGPRNDDEEEEGRFAVLMLLTFVARFINFWRQLNHYHESKEDDPPALPLFDSDYSPSSLLHDFEYTPALPVNRCLFNVLDELDDYHEPTIAEGLGGHLLSVFFERRSQLTFLRILSEYMDVNNEDPSPDRTIPDEFITDWFPKNVILADVQGAFDFLEMQHEERQRQIKAKSNYWDPYEQMAYEYGCKIWGNDDDDDDDDDDVVVVDSIRTQDEHESQIAWNVTEEVVSKEDWTHLDTEIAILDRVVGYKVRNGRNPFSDDSDLADFIKNWLRIDVPVKEFNQLMTCLRDKYEKRAGKRPLNEDSSSKTKEDKVLDLALKIWG